MNTTDDEDHGETTTVSSTLHVSLSRCVYLERHQIDGFVDGIRRLLISGGAKSKRYFFA
jgi:hypothetical protein